MKDKNNNDINCRFKVCWRTGKEQNPWPCRFVALDENEKVIDCGYDDLCLRAIREIR